MKISQLVNQIDIEADLCLEWDGAVDAEIKSLAFNTKDITPGSLFFCIVGMNVDGHDFAEEAISKGAVALVTCRDINISKDNGVAIIRVKDTRKAMSILSAGFFGNPARKIHLIGITGTNGKTTSSFMMKSILEHTGVSTGILGTIYNKIGDHIVEAKRTTPESMDLQKLFGDMAEQGVHSCVMEVSSHSLELSRVYGVPFKVGIFTNLTQDHLDYHGTMENYFKAKLKLFDQCEAGVFNLDDAYGKRAYQETTCGTKYSFGIDAGVECDVYADQITVTGEGSIFTLHIKDKSLPVSLSLPGKFNIYNALGCLTAALCQGIEAEEAVKGLMKLKNVPGRSEKINTTRGVTFVIDYAHSPDGIINILKTAREYTEGRLTIVFGCGGDRDRTKRSIMGRAAGSLADYCIVTSDNPRSEDPEAIIEEILPGVKETGCKFSVFADRTRAIEHAVATAKSKDVVIIAGKGHETYQILKDKTIHYDEREILKELLGEDMI